MGIIKKPKKKSKKTHREPDVIRFDMDASQIHCTPNLEAKSNEEQLQDILSSGLHLIQKLVCKGTLSATEQNHLKVMLTIHQVINCEQPDNTKNVKVTIENKYEDMSAEELLTLANEAHDALN